MASAESQIRALRLGVAWSRMGHVSCVRVRGPHAYELVDGVSTADLFLRDTQILSALLLNDDATVAADIFVGRDDEDFLILAEGLTAHQLAAMLRYRAAPDLEFSVDEITPEQSIISVNGPFAWELLGEVIGPDIIGLPYLSFLHVNDGICFRAGKTGEFGYDLLLPQPAAEDFLEQIQSRGEEFDLVNADLEALDQCALENWFFNIRCEGQVNATPLELQLQWRVSYRKDFVGAAALRERKSRGAAQRITTLVANEPVAAGDTVMLGDSALGPIVNAGYSCTRADYVALALLDRAWAAAGVSGYEVLTAGRRVPVRTVSPPVINNRSLHVSPQLHSYRTRDDTAFPDLCARQTSAG